MLIPAVCFAVSALGIYTAGVAVQYGDRVGCFTVVCCSCAACALGFSW
jgi:hypothetical protein